MLKIFEEAIVIGDKIIIEDHAFDVIKGKHEFWIPEMEAKIIWSWNGRIESYTDWDKGRNRELIETQKFNENMVGFNKESIQSIQEEYSLLDKLGKWNMAPPVSGIFYIKNFITDYPYYRALNCDSKGVYGIFVKNAEKLVEGKFNRFRFEEIFVDPGLVELSEGAFGDLGKENNMGNGYLIDVRRTLWDSIRWKGELAIKNIEYREDVKKLEKRILDLCQFPYGRRKHNYQSYLLGEVYIEGSRDTLYRFKQMEIEEDLSGKTVLDLGSQLGAMCLEAYKRGARWITGLESEMDYVNCARDLVRANGFQINYIKKDLSKDTKTSIGYINTYYKNPVDIIFALSMYKHIGDSLWDLLRGISWKTCYVESNNAPDGMKTEHVHKMVEGMSGLDCEFELIGKTEDRSPRMIWRLKR